MCVYVCVYVYVNVHKLRNIVYISGIQRDLIIQKYTSIYIYKCFGVFCVYFGRYCVIVVAYMIYIYIYNNTRILKMWSKGNKYKHINIFVLFKQYVFIIYLNIV